MRNQLQALLAEVKPDIVIYEGYAMGGKGRVFHIGELGGVFALTLYEAGVTVQIIPPTTLKMAITGAGAAGKQYRGTKNPNKAAMRDALQARYGVNLAQDDEADAYALLMLGEHHHGITAPPPPVGKSAQGLASLSTAADTVPGRRLQTISKKACVA